MIPILDVTAQYKSIREEVDAAISEVLLSGDFILGRAVKTFEEELSAYCNCKYGLGVASGTDALRLSLTALGIGSGDEVITTPFTFIATANTISHTGAYPVFVDIEPLSYNIDPRALQAAITPRTRAIVPVHLYGQSADMTAIMAIARLYGLAVVEDCAQALGAQYNGRPVGSFGNVGCLSFYPTKNLGGCGDGGMVVTNDSELKEKIDILRRQGGREKYQADVLGFNSRLDSLQAAILRVKLRYLDRWNEQRRRVARWYGRLLQELPVALPHESVHATHVYHQYTIRTSKRDELATWLHHHGVATMIYYPTPLHRQRVYTHLGYGAGSLPNAENASTEVLSLPMFPELTEEQIERVADAIQRFFVDRKETVSRTMQQDAATTVNLDSTVASVRRPLM